MQCSHVKRRRTASPLGSIKGLGLGFHALLQLCQPAFRHRAACTLQDLSFEGRALFARIKPFPKRIAQFGMKCPRRHFPCRRPGSSVCVLENTTRHALRPPWLILLCLEASDNLPRLTIGSCAHPCQGFPDSLSICPNNCSVKRYTRGRKGVGSAKGELASPRTGPLALLLQYNVGWCSRH